MRYAYAPFVTWLIIIALAFGIGSWVRGCSMEVRSSQVQKARDKEADRLRRLSAFRELEGKTDGPLTAVANAVRTIAADPNFKELTFDEIVDLAAGFKKMSEAQLKAIGAPVRWPAFRALGNLPAFDAMASLSRGTAAEAVLGKRDVSSTLERPVPIPDEIRFFGSTAFWLVVYLIACGFLVVLWIIGTYSDKANPLSIRWKHPAPILTLLTAAPATVPVLLLSGVGWCLYRFFKDGEAFVGRAASLARRFLNAGLRAGYRLRLFRRLPAPVLVPLPASPASETVRPDAAAPAAPTAERGWIVVDPRLVLGRRHLLARADVPVYPILLRVPDRIEGLAIPESRVRSFEEALKLAGTGREDVPTDVLDVAYRRYSRRVGEARLGRLDHHEGIEADLRLALEEASVEIGGAELSLYDGNGHAAAPSPDGRWTIWAFAVPDGPIRRGGHDRLYGVSLGRSLHRLEPTDRGAVIFDPDSIPVAQVFGRNVYLLVDLLFIGSGLKKPELMSECLVRILHAAFVLRDEAKIDDEMLRQLWQADMSEHRRQYVATCLSRLEAQKAELVKNVEKCDLRIRDAGVAITRDLRERQSLQARLSSLEASEWQQELERLGKEFDALAASKVVTAARAYPDRVEADTTTVRIRHEGKTYLIGRFRIILRHDGQIEMRNLENAGRQAGVHHPHVTNRACLGNLAEPLGKYMAEREYATVVALLHRFLESYNPGSPLAKIDNWPTVKE